MQLFELALASITICLVIAICFLPSKRNILLWLFRIGVGVQIFHILFEIPRWQSAFTYLVFWWIGLMFIRKSTAHFLMRLVGFIVGVTLVGTSIFLTWGMPLVSVPKPSGPFAVGITSMTITDTSRVDELSLSGLAERQLFLEVWYPTNVLEGDKGTLWQELYKGDLDGVSFFTEYLKGVQTNAIIDAPPIEHEKYPLILFNHGLQMFTSQNTQLMEQLASQGYIIVSIGHTYESLRINLNDSTTILPKFITSFSEFGKAMQWISETSAPIMEAQNRIKNLDSMEERAQIMSKAIQNSPLNAVVERWVMDNQFVLDQLLDSIQRYDFQASIDTSKIGVMGMSIGGATATELAKSDNRVKAAINIDGLQYGNRNQDPLQIPFMMVYSGDGLGVNEFLALISENDYHRYDFLNSKHADFTDIPIIWPLMKVYGQLGEVPGEQMITTSNRLILNFWDYYLKEKTWEPISEEFFTVESKFVQTDSSF